MLAYPVSTTRKEKLEMIHIIKERLLAAHREVILAIGAYGSIALETDGPFSDIELHVITKEASQLESLEFIYTSSKSNSAQKTPVHLSNKQKKWTIHGPSKPVYLFISFRFMIRPVYSSKSKTFLLKQWMPTGGTL